MLGSTEMSLWNHGVAEYLRSSQISNQSSSFQRESGKVRSLSRATASLTLVVHLLYLRHLPYVNPTGSINQTASFSSNCLPILHVQTAYIGLGELTKRLDG